MISRRFSRGAPGTASHGFTLIEVLVVVVIVGILAAMLVLSLGAIGDDRELQREAQRLASLMELAGEEAELQGRDFGVEFIRQGYRFVEFDPIFERWGEILGDEVLRQRKLPVDMELELLIEDRRIELADEPAVTQAGDEEDDSPLLERFAPHGMLLSSGDLSPLKIDVVRLTDQATVRINIDVDNTIKIVTDADEFE